MPSPRPVPPPSWLPTLLSSWHPTPLPTSLALLLCLMGTLTACDGPAKAGHAGVAAANTADSTVSPRGTAGTAGTAAAAGAGANAAAAAGEAAAAGTAAAAATAGAPGATGAAGPAAAIAVKLGRDRHLLVGLGTYSTVETMRQQGIRPDIIDTYLTGVGKSSWIDYVQPAGAYITKTAQEARDIGAIPLYTLYGMAQNGDGNVTGILSRTFMRAYWAQARLMFQLLGQLDAPVLVNLEPDFWGYVYNYAPAHDPAQLGAVVSSEPECRTLPDLAPSVAPCLLAMARQYAPKALVGMPPALWGRPPGSVAAYMRAMGAAQADFVVAQTSDRDAGCAEVAAPPPECAGRTGPFYWNDLGGGALSFRQSQQDYAEYARLLGGNPTLLWWQTPLGVPSTTPGGTLQHFRDNHVDYMLQHTAEYAAIHTLGMVFSGGAAAQTSISTDGGQFARLWKAYQAGGGTPLQ